MEMVAQQGRKVAMIGLPGHSLASRRLFLTGGATFAGAVVAPGMLAHPTLAQEADGGHLQRALDRGHVIVGTGSATPPWHFEDEDGQLTGMDVAMSRILATALFDDPEKVEFVQQAADARIPNLLSDKVDIVIQFMSITAARAQLVDFTMPYYREAITIVLLADSEYNTLADVQGQGITVAALQNPHIEDVAHEGIPDAVVDQYDSVANTILALDGGRVDAMLADYSTAQWITAQDPEKYKYVTDTWATHNYGTAVAPGDARWFNFVNQVWLDAMTGFQFAAFHDAFMTYFGIDLKKPPAGAPLILAGQQG
jgi:polar amino acid transport system substrate-binding protein